MENTVVFDSVGGLKVLNPQRESVVLESLWKDRRVVLVFLRHFG